jgi:hypothetical protein
MSENPIVQVENVDGFQVWGQKSEQSPVQMDRVGLRRLCFVIEKNVRRILSTVRYKALKGWITDPLGDFSRETTEYMRTIVDRKGCKDDFVVEIKQEADKYVGKVVFTRVDGTEPITIYLTGDVNFTIHDDEL